MSLLKRLFGIKTTDFNQLLEDGAYIIDVRTSLTTLQIMFHVGDATVFFKI